MSSCSHILIIKIPSPIFATSSIFQIFSVLPRIVLNISTASDSGSTFGDDMITTSNPGIRPRLNMKPEVNLLSAITPLEIQIIFLQTNFNSSLDFEGFNLGRFGFSSL